MLGIIFILFVAQTFSHVFYKASLVLVRNNRLAGYIYLILSRLLLWASIGYLVYDNLHYLSGYLQPQFHLYVFAAFSSLSLPHFILSAKKIRSSVRKIEAITK